MEENVFGEYFDYLAHVPSANMDVAGFMNCSAARHQGAI